MTTPIFDVFMEMRFFNPCAGGAPTSLELSAWIATDRFTATIYPQSAQKPIILILLKQGG